jgi:hypothetical protein
MNIQEGSKKEAREEGVGGECADGWRLRDGSKDEKGRMTA